jgi:hypothetical protein
MNLAFSTSLEWHWGCYKWSEYKQCFSQSCQLIIFNGGISVSKWLLEYSGKTLKQFLWAWECMSSDYNQCFLCSCQLSNTLNWDFRRVNGASQNLLRINLASYWCSFDSISPRHGKSHLDSSGAHCRRCDSEENVLQNNWVDSISYYEFKMQTTCIANCP